ncbi:MAG TPA: SGNH/GDSL hydrolase family protein [Candidatus Woesebacteria bacterium]|nr:SGNH/GDSL hydrolase family protein [Candidatus Woesebacteria bacterium]
MGASFLGYYYKETRVSMRSFDQRKVAIINRGGVEKKPSPNFLYYSELVSNNIIESQLPWDSGVEIKYKINNDGLNDRKNYDLVKPKNTFRIITLGDSFTFGHYVSTDNNWPEQLEELLNTKEVCPSTTIEVINLGMWGFDINYLIKRYKDIGKKYEPDMVVWFESGSGFTRLVETMEPLSVECEKQIENFVSLDVLKRIKYSGECWGQSQHKVVVDLGEDGLKRVMTTYLDDLFTILDQSIFFYVTFEKIESGINAESTLNFWKNRYDKVHFSKIPNLKQGELFPDGHPSTLGHKKIAESIFELVKESNSQELCITEN